MQQDGIAENEENRGTWMEMKMVEATPSHTEKRFKIWKLQLQMVRVFCSYVSRCTVSYVSLSQIFVLALLANWT